MSSSAPAQHRYLSRRWLFLVAAVVVYAAYAALAAHASSTADNAYKHFDCKTAANTYSELSGIYKLAFTAHRDEKRRGQCAQVLLAERLAAAGDHAGAVHVYGPLARGGKLTPIEPQLRSRYGSELVAWGDGVARRARKLDNGALLGRAAGHYRLVVDQLPRSTQARVAVARLASLWPAARHGSACWQAQALSSLAALTDTVPAVARLAARAERGESSASLACGKTELAGGRYATAIRWLRTATQHSAAGSLLRASAGRALIDAEVALIRGRGTGSLPAPTADGSSGQDAPQVRIRNSSPYPIELLLSGPRSTSLEIPACRGCHEYPKSAPPSTCPPGPVETFTATAGGYEAVVRTPKHNVTPWSGKWIFKPGIRYSSCFFVVGG